MSDQNETIRRDRNFVERIVQLVPGFRGYYDRENRREADRVVRMFGVSRLEEIVSELHEMTKRAPLAEKDVVQECVNQAEKLQNAIRHSDQGYSGFFSEVKWDRRERLAAIYELDEQISGRLASLAECVTTGEIPVADLRSELVELQRAVANRRETILNLGSA